MNTNIKHFLITILFGTIACLIIGIIIYGLSIFRTNNMRFVIVLYAFSGSLFFGALKYLKLREQIFSIIFLLLVTVLLRGKTSHLLFYLRDVYLLLPLFTSIYLYVVFVKKYVNVPIFIRGLFLAFVLPSLYLLSLLLLGLIMGVNFQSASHSLFVSFRLAVIVGAGLAFGFDLCEKYKTKFVV